LLFKKLLLAIDIIFIFGASPWMKKLPLGAYYTYFPVQTLPDIAWVISGNPCQSGKYA